MKQLGQYNHAVLQALIEGQGKALQLFHETAERVPAYKKFLKQNDVNPKSIKTFDDFTKLPLVSKESYLKKFPLNELIWDGDLTNSQLISVSSGSTGKPFYWLRGQAQEQEAANIYRRIYKDMFACDQKRTLLVVCFSMGTWIAGSYTTLGALDCAKKGLKLNIITPSIEMPDAISSIRELYPYYEQVILAGYPPFIKDLLDAGEDEGLAWGDMNLGITVAGEAITEELRDYLLEKGGMKDPTRVINIYGTADAGIVAHETPLTVLLRRILSSHHETSQHVFHKPILPTIAHFDPRIRYFEEHEGNLIFTAPAGIPLIRYDIKDAGGIITALNPVIEEGIGDELEAGLGKLEYSLRQWKNPILYVHGRDDFTATLYAVLIYPENIKSALFREPLEDLTTGKFVMETKSDAKLNQYLQLTIELQHHIKPNPELRELFAHRIAQVLKEQNAEYRKLSSVVGRRAIPRVHLKAYGDEKAFPKANKHRWVPKRK